MRCRSVHAGCACNINCCNISCWPMHRGDTKHDVSVFFTPQRSLLCERLLKSEGVWGDLAIADLPVHWVPYDTDALSLELENVFRVRFCRENEKKMDDNSGGGGHIITNHRQCIDRIICLHGSTWPLGGHLECWQGKGDVEEPYATTNAACAVVLNLANNICDAGYSEGAQCGTCDLLSSLAIDNDPNQICIQPSSSADSRWRSVHT